MKILFPLDPINSKDVDFDYKNEYGVAKTLGIETFLYDHDLLADEGAIRFFGLKDERCSVILRGWMLKPEQYKVLYESLESKNHFLCTNPESYKRCHYLKESYSFIEKFTVKTLFTQNYNRETLGKMFDQFTNGIVLKDYVKSEKGIPGLFRIPKETTHEQLQTVVGRFVEARGRLFNEGIAFREYLELKRIDGEVNEWRIFVFKNKVVAFEQNSNINILHNGISKPPANLIGSVIESLNGASPFYTIDFAEKLDGGWIVVETGDGQVSGLAPKQNPIGLYNALMEN